MSVLVSELEPDQHFGESKTPRCAFLLSPGSNKDRCGVPGMVEGLTDITSCEISDTKKACTKGIQWRLVIRIRSFTVS